MKLAATPTKLHVTVIPTEPFLVIPKVNSICRQYAPIGYLAPPMIPSDLVLVGLDANLRDFALLTSAMHMAWLRHVGRRLGNSYRYSIGSVYNTFPIPREKNSRRTALISLAKAVLSARAFHPGATLADLYDSDLMPLNLRGAHSALDRAVDRLYRPASFASDSERLSHLLMRYAEMRRPLVARRKRR